MSIFPHDANQRKPIGNEHPSYSAFSLAHDKKMTCDFARCVPILCEEVIPGDRLEHKCEIKIEALPMLSPAMARMNVYVHYFFVPFRILWKPGYQTTGADGLLTGGWEEFITNAWNGKLQDADRSTFPKRQVPPSVIPTFPLTSKTNYFMTGDSTPKQRATDHFVPGSLADYLGYPTNKKFTDNTTTKSAYDTNTNNIIRLSQFPFRAYWQIMMDYYVNENIDDPFNVRLNLDWWFMNRMYDNRLPFQFSDDGAPITTVVDDNYYDISSYMARLGRCHHRNWEHDYFTNAMPWSQKGNPVEVGSVIKKAETTTAGNITADASGKLNYVLDGSFTINDLRTAYQVQKFLERDARNGTKYHEFLRSHFGDCPNSGFLQRAQYLGGHAQPLQIQSVDSSIQQSGTTYYDQLGAQAGQVKSYKGHSGFHEKFHEHGIVMGIMSVLPRSGYINAMQPQWLHKNRYDFFFPEFAHLSEVAIKKGELSYSFNATDDGAGKRNSDTFGYKPIYEEYRTRHSSSHGEMKTTMAYWNSDRLCGQKSDGEQVGTIALDTAFLDPTRDSSYQRLFGVIGPNEQTQLPRLWAHIYNDLTAYRPMPKHGEPGLSDHF